MTDDAIIPVVKTLSKEAHRRTEEERERDLPTIASLYVKGVPQATILEQINAQYPPERHITKDAISHDIKDIRKRWLDSALVDFNSMKAKELAHLDEVEKELWDAWEHSKEPYFVIEETEHKGQVPLRTGKVVDVNDATYKKREEHPIGDIKIMGSIISVIDMRCKLLGLMEAQRYIVDWRTEARSVGWSDGEVQKVYDSMVTKFVEAIQSTKDDEAITDAEFLDKSSE